MATKKPSRRHKISIRHIAEEMNVAVSTVSRALSGDAGVSDEKAREIRDYALRVGYTPSPLRRSIKQAIGLIITTDNGELVMDRYQKTVLFYVDRCVSALGLHLHVQFIPRGQKELWPAALKDNRVDGLILTGHPDEQLCHQLRAELVPVVVLNDTIERTGCSCVLADPTPATTEAVKRLIEMGHRHIGAVITNREYPTVEKRYQAYYFALFDAGIRPDPDWVVQHVEPNLNGGREAIQHYLKQDQLPSAIVFTNDWIALGGIMELMKLNYRIGEDISVVGHDNDPICLELSPQLTTCDICIEETVKEALNLLNQQIHKKITEPEEIIIPGKLIWRDSCLPPHAEGEASSKS